MLSLWLIAGCAVTALAYATVGMGGGSTYLALLAMAQLDADAVRATALTLNLIVAGGGFYHYRRAGHFDAKLLVPFAITSIPAALVGASIPLRQDVFLALLAITLLLASLRLLLCRPTQRRTAVPWRMAWRWGPLIGAVLGLLAGLVGIGGGIFLAPALLLMGWADAKKAGAAAAAFILVNSVAGLLALAARGNTSHLDSWPLALAVLVGGQVGSRLGANWLSSQVLQRCFGALTLLVAARLAWRWVE